MNDDLPSPAAASPNANSTAPPTFEDSMRDLQRIVGELEQGDLGLTEALERYEQGVQRLRHCYQQLEQAEQRVALVRGLNRQGEAETEPFQEDPMSLGEKAAQRGQRRSRATGSAQGARSADQEKD